MRTEIANALAEINIAIPAKIVSYDPSSVRATVKPTIPKRLSNGETLPAPQIVNVPVCFPMADVGGAVAQITLPMKAGDGVLLVFSHRSLENWLSGSEQSPDDPRMFDLSDAFAMPSTNAKSPSADGENLCIKYGAGTLKITPSGDVLINAPSTTVTAPQNTINGNVQVNGDFTLTGSVTAQGEVTGNGVSLSTHIHTGVKSGNETSGSPQ
ncbi:phage baseplate protein [[Haemophilus] felis]|nr:phage baseplate protein [[Haemophilus] felis]